MTTTDESNRLPELAAQIRRSHAGVQEAARSAAEYAIAAGHALIEAKQLVKHGEWLPWLKDHCAMPERTAQLYMQIAKSGHSAEIVAALGLQAAANEFMQIFDENYRVFAHCTEQGEREFYLFILFLAREWHWHPDGAYRHVEWLSQKQFLSPCDWLTGEGPKARKFWGMREPSSTFLESWRTFLEANRNFETIAEIEAAIAEISIRVGPFVPSPVKRRRRRKSATVADLNGGAA